jgi:hypothetical protein
MLITCLSSLTYVSSRSWKGSVHRNRMLRGQSKAPPASESPRALHVPRCASSADPAVGGVLAGAASSPDNLGSCPSILAWASGHTDRPTLWALDPQSAAGTAPSEGPFPRHHSRPDKSSKGSYAAMGPRRSRPKLAWRPSRSLLLLPWREQEPTASRSPLVTKCCRGLLPP